MEINVVKMKKVMELRDVLDRLATGFWDPALP